MISQLFFQLSQSHWKISILVNDIYNFSSAFFLLKCVSNFMLTSWVRFFFFLRSDNHSKTLVCFFSRSALQPSHFFGLHERPLWRNWRFFRSHKKSEPVHEKTDRTTKPSIIIWSNEKVRIISNFLFVHTSLFLYS